MLCPGCRRNAHRRIESSASLEIEETLNRRMQSQNKTELNVMRRYYVARLDPNPALWLATRWCYLACSGLPAVYHKNNFPRKLCNESFIDQPCSVKMARYWPRSFLTIYEPRRKDLANIRSYPASRWSITHSCRGGFEMCHLLCYSVYILFVHLVLFLSSVLSSVF